LFRTNAQVREWHARLYSATGYTEGHAGKAAGRSMQSATGSWRRRGTNGYLSALLKAEPAYPP
jgi:hypothetical protein